MNKEVDIKVSIVIPVYNCEGTIVKCLDSVLEQSLKEYEILCCDDGSTDNTVEILRRYKAEYKNIILLEQENQGAGPARNRCLEIARGEFVCFLDADDFYFDKNALKFIYESIKNNDLNIGCGLMLKNIEGKVIPASFFRNYVKDGKEKVVNFRDYQYDGFFVCYMISRKLIIENNITFPGLRRFQDPPFLVQCLDIAERFVVVPVEFYYCNVNVNKQFTNPKVVNDMLTGLKWQLEFALDHDYQRLVHINVNRLNEYSYAFHILNALNEDNFQAFELLIEINRLLNREKVELDILKFMISEIKNIDFNSKKSVYEFEKKIPRNSKIILYGAGEKGREIFSAVSMTKSFEVLAWVDKYKQRQCILGKMIVGLDHIENISFDYVLVAIQSPSIAASVRSELKNYRIPDDKIIFYHQEKEN